MQLPSSNFALCVTVTTTEQLAQVMGVVQTPSSAPSTCAINPAFMTLRQFWQRTGVKQSPSSSPMICPGASPSVAPHFVQTAAFVQEPSAKSCLHSPQEARLRSAKSKKNISISFFILYSFPACYPSTPTTFKYMRGQAVLSADCTLLTNRISVNP